VNPVKHIVATDSKYDTFVLINKHKNTKFRMKKI
jgi:hypothetical protein